MEKIMENVAEFAYMMIGGTVMAGIVVLCFAVPLAALRYLLTGG